MEVLPSDWTTRRNSRDTKEKPWSLWWQLLSWPENAYPRLHLHNNCEKEENLHLVNATDIWSSPIHSGVYPNWGHRICWISKGLRFETTKSVWTLLEETKRTEGEQNSQRGKRLGREDLTSLHFSPFPPTYRPQTESEEPMSTRLPPWARGTSSRVHSQGWADSPQGRSRSSAWERKTVLKPLSSRAFFLGREEKWEM